jgi:hypothetical protein
MANYGVSFTLPDNTFYRCWPSISPNNPADYEDKVILVSILDIDYGWDWLIAVTNFYLNDIQGTTLAGHIAFVAVVYDYNGSVNRNALYSKLGNDGTFGQVGSSDPFYIIADKSWGSSLSHTYQPDYGGPDIATDTTGVFWNYIVGRKTVTEGNQNALLDMFDRYTGTLMTLPENSGDITASFQLLHLTTTTGETITDIDPADGNVTSSPDLDADPVDFTSTNNYNLFAFVKKRLENLTSPAHIIAAYPQKGKWINDSFTSMNLFFSKPVRADEVREQSNWILAGDAVGGATPISLAPAGGGYNPSYSHIGNPADKIRIDFTGALIDTNPDKELIIEARTIHDTYGDDPQFYNDPANPGDPDHPIESPVTYYADITPPVITDFIGPQYINSVSLSYSITAEDVPGGGVGTCSGINGIHVSLSDSPPDPNDDALWTEYDGSSPYNGTLDLVDTQGNHTIYAWVRDSVGNRSNVNSLTVTLDKTPPVVDAELQSPGRTDNPEVTIRTQGSDPDSGPNAGSGIAQRLVTSTSSPPPADDPNWEPWDGTEQNTVYDFSAGSGSVPWGENTVYVYAKDAAGNICPGVPIQVILQRTREIILVLDFSGSMLSEEDYDDEINGPGDYTRLYILKAAVSKLVHELAMLESTGENDKIGIVIFHDNLFYWDPDDDGVRLHRILDPALDVPSSIDQYLLGTLTESKNWTGMGAGLAQALSFLNYNVEDDAKVRAIYLITDGEQNKLPLVHISGSAANNDRSVTIDNTNPDSMLIGGANNGQVPDVTASLPISFSETDDPKNVMIHTLGIGSFASWQQTLQDISGASGGHFSADTTAFNGLADFAIDSITATYEGNSPQIVFKTVAEMEKTTKPTILEYSVLLNKSISSLLISLSWVGGTPLTFQLEKDGYIIHQFDKEYKSPQYSLGFLSFPHTVLNTPRPMPEQVFSRKGELFQRTIEMQSGFPWGWHQSQIDAQGELIIRVRELYPGYQNNYKIPFSLSVLAEERAVSLHPFKMADRFYVGDRIDVGIRAFVYGRPLKDLYLSNLFVDRPKQNVGALLADKKIGNFREKWESELKKRDVGLIDFYTTLLTKKETIDTRGSREREVLPLRSRTVKTKSEFEKLRSRKSAYPFPIQLPGDLASSCTGQYSNTKIPGVYRADMLIRGISSESGPFQRVSRHTFIVLFRPEPKKTIKSITIKTTSREVLITLTPKDENGNGLGPGWAYQIFIEVEKIGRYLSSFIDAGTYEIRIPVHEVEEIGDAQIRLMVVGTVIIEGTLREIQAEIEK